MNHFDLSKLTINPNAGAPRDGQAEAPYVNIRGVDFSKVFEHMVGTGETVEWNRTLVRLASYWMEAVSELQFSLHACSLITAKLHVDGLMMAIEVTELLPESVLARMRTRVGRAYADCAHRVTEGTGQLDVHWRVEAKPIGGLRTSDVSLH